MNLNEPVLITAKCRRVVRTNAKATMEHIKTIVSELSRLFQSAKANKKPFNLYKKTCCSHFYKTCKEFLDLQYFFDETAVQTNKLNSYAYESSYFETTNKFGLVQIMTIRDVTSYPAYFEVSLPFIEFCIMIVTLSGEVSLKRSIWNSVKSDGDHKSTHCLDVVLNGLLTRRNF